MSSPPFLNESDIDILIDLLVRSQQSRAREALCFSIGIDPKRLSYLKDSSDSDFFLLLIKYLNGIGDQEALCKLCCKELSPIFDKGASSLLLKDIAKKLNCSTEFRHNSPINKQETIPLSSSAPSVSLNPFNQLAKNKLITGGTILLIGLAGFSLFNPNKNSNSLSTEPYVLKANDPRGITISGKEGQTVTIEASGAVHTRPGGTVSNCDEWTDPNGIRNCHYTNKDRIPYNQPFMALLGKFEDEPPFFIGTNYEYNFNNTGSLRLFINDSDYTDNDGDFKIKTTITN
jgi:hypothetical protein